jgi:2-aminoadipate transaminase
VSHAKKLAARTAAVRASAIREILKVVSRPGMVSMAGGIPAPESFPILILRELNDQILEKFGPSALQYDATEGFYPLREALAEYLSRQGISASPDDVLTASGSQGVLDCLGKVLVDPGDVIAVESPTYLGALQAFNAYEPRYVSLDTDDDGPVIESLETALKQYRPKFTYLAPTFQNPTGRTISLDRRQRIAELAQRYNALIVEDDPYCALRYRGNAVPPLKTMAPDHVVYISTLSKVFAPGLRIGFCLAPEPIHRWLVIAKQGVDLHTSTYNQALAAEYLTGNYLESHLPNIIGLYRARQKAMFDALEAFMPEGVTWTRPEGGMFLWVQGPKGLDIDRVYEEGLRRNVAFVPGKYFYANNGQGLETMRLNFTMFDEGTINRAVETLSEVLAENI